MALADLYVFYLVMPCPSLLKTFRASFLVFFWLAVKILACNRVRDFTLHGVRY